MAIIPREDGILISTMFYADEIKELQKLYSKPEVSQQELSMAATLINSMDTPLILRNIRTNTSRSSAR